MVIFWFCMSEENKIKKVFQNRNSILSTGDMRLEIYSIFIR